MMRRLPVPTPPLQKLLPLLPLPLLPPPRLPRRRGRQHQQLQAEKVARRRLLLLPAQVNVIEVTASRHTSRRVRGGHN